MSMGGQYFSHLISPNFDAHTSDILLSDTNVIFLPLGCVFFFSRYSLSSADKTEEDKDKFECQIHA